jgi:hypothetical protein
MKKTLRIGPSGPISAAITAAAAMLPAHMRSPGFLMLGALSLPTLLVLLASAWRTHGLAGAVIAAVVGLAAIGTCIFAPRPLSVGDPGR